MQADDQRRNDHDEDVFLDRNAKEIHARPQADREDPDCERIPVPDVGDRVEGDDGPGRHPERICPVQQHQRDCPPEELGDEVRVGAENADVGKHIRWT